MRMTTMTTSTDQPSTTTIDAALAERTDDVHIVATDISTRQRLLQNWRSPEDHNDWQTVVAISTQLTSTTGIDQYERKTKPRHYLRWRVALPWHPLVEELSTDSRCWV
jgi:hypothetical protein